jgi:hypothetical protein
VSIACFHYAVSSDIPEILVRLGCQPLTLTLDRVIVGHECLDRRACSSGVIVAGSSRYTGPAVIAFFTAGLSPISSSQRLTLGNSPSFVRCFNKEK